MAANSSLSQKHNILNETTFRLKVLALVAKRFVRNMATMRASKLVAIGHLSDAPVIASSESELLNADDNDSNRVLTAGKIENLRVATRKLNGIEVKAGEVFSFWKYVGMPIKSRGYVIGREIREGCIVPTIAGGLCQLSNALYDAALKAGFEIIERHKHTRVIKGSLAEQDRDATVKWNYIDLRFKSIANFKIVIDFTFDKLVIQFKCYKTSTSANTEKSAFPAQFSKLNDCYSCGNVACFNHPGDVKPVAEKQITTFILDEKWPEYENYINTIVTADDYFIVPFAKESRFAIKRYTWTSTPGYLAVDFRFTAFKRAWGIRRAAKSNGNIPATYLKYDDAIIEKLKNSVPIESTHIVIAQNLVPFAWQQGLLWGRTFDVLMTRLPIEILQQKLDDAHSKHHESKTLNDFRADKGLMDLENTALTKARHIITPHEQIASIFTHKAIKLNWVMPSMQRKNRTKAIKYYSRHRHWHARVPMK